MSEMCLVGAHDPEHGECQIQAHYCPKDMCPIHVLNRDRKEVLQTLMWNKSVTQSDWDEANRGEDQETLAKIHLCSPRMQETAECRTVSVDVLF